MAIEDNSAEPLHRTPIAARTLLLACAALWCLYWFVHAWPYWEDDAYIHLEFARSLAGGHGFAFNGHVVAGDTSPLWVLLLAATHAVIPGWLVAGKVLTVLGAALGLTATYAFARKLAASLLSPGSARDLFPDAMVVLIVANPYTCYWIFSGMEPVAAAGLAFLAVLTATRESPSMPSFLSGCFLAGIAPLVRPEMAFLTMLLALPLFGQWRRLPQSSSKPAALLAGLLLLCAPLACWSLYSLHAFGHLLPNTNAAKRSAPPDSVVRRLLSVYSLGLPLILCGLLAGIAWLVLRPASVLRSLRSALAAAVGKPSIPAQDGFLMLSGWLFLLWPAIATAFYIADHTYVQTRYILVTAPGLTVVILALALRISPRTGRVLYAASLIAALAVSIVTVRPFLRNKGINCVLTRQLAVYIRDHLPPDAPVACYAIGQIAFDSEHPIIDTGGITRPGAIPYLNAPLQVMARWARSEGAQFYLSEPSPDPGSVLVYSTDQMFVGWTLHIANYSNAYPIGLWKLGPSSESMQPAEASLSINP